MSDNVRGYVAEELAPLLAKGYRVIPEQQLPDVFETPIVVIKHARIEKLPEAPLGHLRNEVVLGLFDPHKDVAKAENALDDEVVELLTVIDKHSRIDWTDARKVMHPNQQYRGWDITLSVITGPEPTPEPEPATVPAVDPEEV
ncbi:hypothetical protein [Diaminobutyricimonas sp. LJ205]|uniref:hypothetical protein n=1 Tax=Diaminobutyricimonas sp. LJ205 TaxID=2683590 RepID=UPI0012F4FED2|nr:hypothetical protein [Diaminobutyricimonas sp. LJ205]